MKVNLKVHLFLLEPEEHRPTLLTSTLDALSSPPVSKLVPLMQYCVTHGSDSGVFSFRGYQISVSHLNQTISEYITLPCMLIFTQLVLKAQKNSIILPPSSPTAFPPTAMRTSYSSNTTERPINHLISQL